MLVVDASVACKWFVAESGSAAAEALVAAGQTLLAPDLIVAEVCNVAWLKRSRGEIAEEQATAIVDGLPGMFDELVPSAQLAARALQIANTASHPAYDCFYIALAEQRGASLVTADERLVARLTTTPWARLVAKLGDHAAHA